MGPVRAPFLCDAVLLRMITFDACFFLCLATSKIILTPLPQSVCMKNLHCRSYARGDDVIMSEASLDYVVKTAHALESGELGAHNTVLRDGGRSHG